MTDDEKGVTKLTRWHDDDESESSSISYRRPNAVVAQRGSVDTSVYVKSCHNLVTLIQKRNCIIVLSCGNFGAVEDRSWQE